MSLSRPGLLKSEQKKSQPQKRLAFDERIYFLADFEGPVVSKW